MGRRNQFHRVLADWIYQKQRPGSRGLLIWRNLKELEQTLGEQGPRKKKR
ncbi:MAG TPA: hypothetical protein IAB98_07540 [Candidatus Egerieimonas intestinavium]|uniref:Uncharacterized protein n=1 Tax=Candidatus Egerieimonas intestinavium TaxID=2840777 RepID=A0A9D1JG79_9FIRM|nr:hypothetical protein [Candidatus Egerieimonas intestinavium]